MFPTTTELSALLHRSLIKLLESVLCDYICTYSDHQNYIYFYQHASHVCLHAWKVILTNLLESYQDWILSNNCKNYKQFLNPGDKWLRLTDHYINWSFRLFCSFHWVWCSHILINCKPFLKEGSLWAYTEFFLGIGLAYFLYSVQDEYHIVDKNINVMQINTDT